MPEPMAGMFPPYQDEPIAYTCAICHAGFTCHTVAPMACPNCGHDFTEDSDDDSDPPD
jgi:rubrerythrin